MRKEKFLSSTPRAIHYNMIITYDKLNISSENDFYTFYLSFLNFKSFHTFLLKINENIPIKVNDIKIPKSTKLLKSQL